MKTFIYELKTRRVRTSCAKDMAKVYVSSPKALAMYARRVISDHGREHFLVLHLSKKNTVVGFEVAAIGHMIGVEVHPREVFRTAILGSAASIVVAHNHPSGDPRPSPEDDELTGRLRSAGDLLGIPLLEHVIICESAKFYSYSDDGKLNG